MPVLSDSDVAATHAKAVELGESILRMTTAAGSGHPSTGLSLVHVVVDLMYRRMRYLPEDPWHKGSDRLVLSAGHAVPVIYAAYADLNGAVGDDLARRKLLTVDDLATLRELESVLDGHPNPAEGFPFFDAATGSLGQGLSVAAGLALAARLDGIDKRIYVLLGDGEAREGQVWEALDFIVDHGLTNVCAIFNCNGEGQADKVSPRQSAPVLMEKLGAFGWHAIEVDGHAPEQVAEALDQIGTGDKPVALVARTVKGWGVELMQGINFHGKPVPAEDLERAGAQIRETGRRLGAKAGDALRPPPPTPVDARNAGPAAIRLPSFEEALEQANLKEALRKRRLATRVAYGAALVALGECDPRVVALDADVSNSTYANLFAAAHPERFFECKIGEQNMVSAAVGLAAAGKIPFASSFGKFLARAADQIDMATVSRANVKLVGSHVGVSLGADGPSQMSMADVAYFRSMTRTATGDDRLACHVFHPSDAVSAYRCCELMANVSGLCYLRTHRPDAPFLYPPDERFELRGCKRLRRGSDLTLVSAGYMLHTVIEAADRLARLGISCNVFDAYTFPLDCRPIFDATREAGGAILSIEDNYVGGLGSELAEAAGCMSGISVTGITVSRMPKSAKTAGEIFDYVGVGCNAVVQRARALVLY